MTARLLKVVVQPVFVMDDGDQLDEVVAEPVTVSGREWRRFAASSFGPDELLAIGQQWEAERTRPESTLTCP